MLLRAPKLFLLVAVFQLISREKSQVVAWYYHHTTTIAPSPSFQSASAATLCSRSQFSCPNGNRCIPDYWLCDGYNDCGDNSDEMSQNCYSSLQTIAPSATMQSASVTSHAYCYYWQFRCNGYGQCVDRSDVCNGRWNCHDGSDEWNCLTSSQVITPSSTMLNASVTSYVYCYSWQFRCNRYGQCVDRYYLCDGRRHCYDGSDEWYWNCPRTSQVIAPSSTTQSPSVSPSYCYSWQFRCDNGQCVDRYNLCDGRRHCYDGSDEWYWNCPRTSQVIAPSSTTQSPSVSSSYCYYWQFRCDNGQCVNRYNLCDGWRHCYDGSDEWYWNCPRTSQVITPSSTIQVQSSSACPSWEFSCSSYGQCIPQNRVCDGYQNCHDGSDEWRCNTRDKSSNYGRHFVLGFTEQHYSSSDIIISVVAKFNTDVTITAFNSSRPLFTSHIQAGKVMEYKLPNVLRMEGTNIQSKGIEVKSTKDITVFCLNHGSTTSDGYLALPTNALGTVYVVASYQARSSSNFGIISGNDETNIRITLNTIGTITYRGISYSKGSSFSITLDKLETFHMSHSYDLSGTIITANKPISVLSGDKCANVGGGACDHLAAFLLPVKNWGKEFVVATTGSMNKGVGDIFRVFAYENNTIVRRAGREISDLSSGEFTEIDLGGGDLASSINCSKPCQVVQYVKGYRTGFGYHADPSIIILPSIKQFLSYYHVNFFALSHYRRHSVTLLIKRSYNDGLVMNGIRMRGLPWETIIGTEYTWTVANVSTFDSVTIFHTSPEATFGLLVFGEGNYVSYGYPGGFALTHTSDGHSTGKCRSKVDLGFILDSSGSVPFNDFQKMKTFVKDLTNFFTISSDETRVSVMTFASHATIHITFSHLFSDKRSLDSAVNNIGYSGGGTATAMALNFAYTHMFSRSYGARGTEVKKVVIILTDGRSNSGMVSGPARRLKNSGVVIFSVGIGPYLSTHELHAMASEPTGEHVIRLDNFSQLSALAKQMSARTCNASHFLVFCNNDYMTAVFQRADLPNHVNVDRLYLRDRRCKASYNSTHVFIDSPLTGCGTLYKETEQMMFFTNTLSERSQNVPEGGVITRDYLFKANFTCSYGRKRTVGTFSFEPAQQRLTVNLKGGGNFTFAMDFYKSSSFVESYTIYDYPVFKHLSDFIYIQYSVDTSSADLVVHAETCRATPTNRPYDNPQYVFIANGCDNDTTIQHFGYGMSSVQRFSIQAFRFLTQHRFVYIHCDLVVCNRNYFNSTCARGNTCSRRYRRDVNRMSSSDDSSRMYPLSFGPLMYSKESDDDESTGESDAKANYSMIGSLAGIGCLAFVLAGALVYVMKRGKLRRVSPSPPITKVLPMPEEDEASV